MKKINDANFTAALTRALKARRGPIHCTTDADGFAYVTNGHFLVKLTPAEYDAFVRPFAQRDAGAWVLDEHGKPMERQPLNGAEYLAAHAHDGQPVPVQVAPFTFDPKPAKKRPAVVAYYSDKRDFVAIFDAAYTAIIDPARVSVEAASAKHGLIAFSGADPVALVLPLRPIESDGLTASVRAYFNPTSLAKTEGQPKTDDHAAELDALRQELEQTRAQLAAAQTVQTIQNAADTPAVNKLDAVISALQALPGIDATVKGARTTAPVVWIVGGAEAHKAELEKLGAKWSKKRSAYYIQAA